MTNTRPIAVIGLGNIIMRDDGFGVHAVRTMQERYTFSPDVELIDGGTLGLDLLSLIEGRERILFIDAVNFGKGPGFVGMMRDNAIPSFLSTKLSVHHIGLSDLLFAAKLKDLTPSEMVLIGVEPQEIDLGLDMTEAVNSKLDKVIDAAIDVLEEWNVRVSRNPVKNSLDR